MSSGYATGDVSVEVADDHVATVEIHRPPENFFDFALIAELADAIETLDDDPACRAVVLCSEGKSFCAGARLGSNAADGPDGSERQQVGNLYDEAVRLFRTKTPVVAAVQGAAVGGGLGVAMMADFRVAAPDARFVANFARLGFHQGFGLTVTLPAAIGQQKALELLYTGRRVKGDEAFGMGLCDRLVPLDMLRETAHDLAAEIAASAPLAIESIRATMRDGLADRVRAATDHELAEQQRLRSTADFAEGVAAMNERRTPHFQGR